MGEMIGNFSEPATCDRLQESFSVNLWKEAFEEALQRLCPVQATRRQCGCLHVLTRMVHFFSFPSSGGMLVSLLD
jgi:hypothetical protein